MNRQKGPNIMKPTNLLFRNDTILGVCEAIGRDFGFHPNWLRVTLAVAVYFAPAAVIGGYLAAGLIVAAVRWIAPDQIVPAAAVPANQQYELVEAGLSEGAQEVQLAA